MKYYLTFYDNFYHTCRLAYDSTLYGLLRHFGFWMDTCDEWYLHRCDGDNGDNWTLIGRSAKAAKV